MFPDQSLLNDIKREKIKAIKEVFGNRIKQNFLIQIWEEVKNKMGNEIFKYFRNAFQINGEALLKGNPDTFIDYEICRNIVGIHRSNTIFMDDSERAKCQDNSEYRKKLIDEVCDHIRLRPFVGQYARLNQIAIGDEFLFFPIPYKLFAMCIKANQILIKHQNIPFYSLYSMIFNKGLSALCLLENNMFDCIYPICRAIIEIYIKMLVLMINPSALNKYEELCEFALEKGCNDEFSEEFYDVFKNRKRKEETSKLNYLHYGWFDEIPDFESKVDNPNYSFNSLFEYLINHYLETYHNANEYFGTLKYLYGFCHTFTHGTIGNSGFPLAHYFNSVEMLELTIEYSYIMLCKQINVDLKINNVNVIGRLEENIKQFMEQASLRSTENFERYYQTFNCFTIK